VVRLRHLLEQAEDSFLAFGALLSCVLPARIKTRLGVARMKNVFLTANWRLGDEDSRVCSEFFSSFTDKKRN
jgi:hypothetical protein